MPTHYLLYIFAISTYKTIISPIGTHDIRTVCCCQEVFEAIQLFGYVGAVVGITASANGLRCGLFDQSITAFGFVDGESGLDEGATKKVFSREYLQDNLLR
jgi:putative component of membrane protein insertase Oxa1/YidC/SpoIIIJ protein YidD